MLINAGDEQLKSRCLNNVTPYFAPLKPLLHALRGHIRAKIFTHDIFIDLLTDAISQLLPKKAEAVKEEISMESPIERILLPDDLVLSKEIALRTDLRGLGRINGPGLTIKGVTTYHAVSSSHSSDEHDWVDIDDDSDGEGQNDHSQLLEAQLKKKLASGSRDDSFLKMNI